MTSKRPMGERLRRGVYGDEGVRRASGGVLALCAEAADEIERLRATLELQQRSYEREIALDVAAERERCARLCETADGFRDQREHGGKLAAMIRRA